MTLENEYSEIEDLLFSNLKIAIIAISIEYDFFECLSSESLTTEEFIKRYDFDSEILRSLIQTFKSLQLVIIDPKNNRLTLSETAKVFFLKSSRYFQGIEFSRKADPKIKTRIISALHEKKASLEYSGSRLTDMWETGEIDLNSAETFTHIMHSMMAYTAFLHCSKSDSELLSESEIIDLGGGSGVWALEILSKNPKIDVTIFDLENVINVTKEILKNETTAANIKLISGNFFNSVPKSSSYILSNILHDWPLEKCRHILKNISNSINSKGSVYINECLLENNSIDSQYASMFDFLMKINHSSQQFHLTELNELLLQAGFTFEKIVSKATRYSLIKYVKA